MKLYEITEQYMQLLDFAEDPDIDPQVLADTMESIEGEFEDKADGYAKVLLALDADAEAIKSEIDRLQGRKKALENNSKRIKENLQRAMILCDKRKFKTTLFSFNIQKNAPSVVIDETDIFKIPQEYIVFKDPEVNKTAIRDALKAGVDLEGIAHLQQGESLRIR